MSVNYLCDQGRARASCGRGHVRAHARASCACARTRRRALRRDCGAGYVLVSLEVPITNILSDSNDILYTQTPLRSRAYARVRACVRFSASLEA